MKLALYLRHFHMIIELFIYRSAKKKIIWVNDAWHVCAFNGCTFSLASSFKLKFSLKLIKTSSEWNIEHKNAHAIILRPRPRNSHSNSCFKIKQILRVRRFSIKCNIKKYDQFNKYTHYSTFRVLNINDNLRDAS